MSGHLPCAPIACSACPWRRSNQGRPHPHGWYDQSNLDRLWAGLRTGEAPGMTCHPTDANNLVPEGHKAAPEDGTKLECTGSLVLIQRELRVFEKDVQSYSKRAPFLSRDGLIWWAVKRGSALAGTMLGGPPMPVLLDDQSIYYGPIARARTATCSPPVSAGSSTASPECSPATTPSRSTRAAARRSDALAGACSTSRRRRNRDQ